MTTQEATRVEIVSKSENYIFDGLYSYSVTGWDGDKLVDVSGSWGGGYDGPSTEWAQLTPAPSAATLAAVNDFQARIAAVRQARIKLDALMCDALSISRGDVVVVTAGRKVPLGTIGRVFWLEDAGGWNRCGIKADGSEEPIWTYVKNVKRHGEQPDFPTLAELRAEYLGPRA